MPRLMPSLALLLGILATPSASLGAEAYAVIIDQSLPVALPAGAQRVMIGNPAIADINVVDARTGVLLGRSYGTTNLLVLDAGGRTLLERQIVVAGSDFNRVSVYRGDAVNPSRVDNFACSPRCERTPMPGEPEAEYNRYAPPYTSYSSRTNEGRTNGGSAKPIP